MRRLGQEKTILLSTHILQEVKAMASRVIMINEGRLVFDGTPEELDRVDDLRVRQFVRGEAGERLMEMREALRTVTNASPELT